MKMDTETAMEVAIEILEDTYFDECNCEIFNVKTVEKELDYSQYNDWDLKLIIDHSVDGERCTREWVRQQHLNGPRPEDMILWREVYN